jgi:hypothetical protein
MLPSERVRIAGKHRIRALSYRVWVCGCGFSSDIDPDFFRVAVVGGRLYGPNICPQCGAQALWRETRRRD